MDMKTDTISISASQAVLEPGSNTPSEGPTSGGGRVLRRIVVGVGLFAAYLLLLIARQMLLP